MYDALMHTLGFLYIGFSSTFSVISHELKALYHSTGDLVQSWILEPKNEFYLKFLIQC